VNVPLQFLTVTDSRCVGKPFGASQEAPANVDETEQQQAKKIGKLCMQRKSLPTLKKDK